MKTTHDIQTVYVPLLNEGTNAWRPVQAEKLEEQIYRILSKNEPASEEEWQFSTGSIVRCATRQLSDNINAVVAVELVQEENQNLNILHAVGLLLFIPGFLVVTSSLPKALQNPPPQWVGWAIFVVASVFVGLGTQRERK